MLTGQFNLALSKFSIKAEFQIPSHKITVIRGKSGSGKTQFLKCLAGLNTPTHDSFLYYNTLCWQDNKNNIFIPPDKRDISFVFQQPALFPHLSITQNLNYGYKRTPKKKQTLHPADVIDGLQLNKIINHPIKTLSGGEKQRVSIARALLTSPKLLLMDEPISSIDDCGKDEVLSYLKTIQRKLSMTLIYVTHSKEEDRLLAENTLTFENGKLY